MRGGAIPPQVASACSCGDSAENPVSPCNAVDNDGLCSPAVLPRRTQGTYFVHDVFSSHLPQHVSVFIHVHLSAVVPLAIISFSFASRADQGCSAKASVEAVRNGYLDVVRYLREFHLEMCGDCLAARAVAEANGHDNVARWLGESDTYMVQALEEAVMACELLDGTSSGKRGSETDRYYLETSNSSVMLTQPAVMAAI